MRNSVVITPYPDLGKFGAYVPASDRWTEGHSVALLTTVTVADPVEQVA